MPPPTISIRFGSLGSSSAPVEVTTRGSSFGMNGSFTASEPAAMTARAKPIVVVPPAASSTLTWLVVGEPAAAGDDRDLAHLGHLRQAAGQPADDLVLVRDAAWRGRPSARRSSTPTASKCATSSITAATCSIAFDGMQPTLRQTPPSVG